MPDYAWLTIAVLCAAAGVVIACTAYLERAIRDTLGPDPELHVERICSSCVAAGLMDVTHEPGSPGCVIETRYTTIPELERQLAQRRRDDQG